jgi:hypothetical protein
MTETLSVGDRVRLYFWKGVYEVIEVRRSQHPTSDIYYVKSLEYDESELGIRIADVREKV